MLELEWALHCIDEETEIEKEKRGAQFLANKDQRQDLDKMFSDAQVWLSDLNTTIL